MTTAIFRFDRSDSRLPVK